MTERTYTSNFSIKEMQDALEISKDGLVFLSPYNGDVVTNLGNTQKVADWDPKIAKIMDRFDEAWRDLAQL